MHRVSHIHNLQQQVERNQHKIVIEFSQRTCRLLRPSFTHAACNPRAKPRNNPIYFNSQLTTGYILNKK